MTREEFMKDENWGPCDGGQNRARGAGDVMIRVTSGGYTKSGQRISLVFRFYDGAEKKIGNSCYCNFRAIDNKIYFRSEQEGKGYKLGRYENKGKNCEMKATVKDRASWEKFAGCYNLLYDRSLELYYIEQNKKR